jgi:hypothetical protein
VLGVHHNRAWQRRCATAEQHRLARNQHAASDPGDPAPARQRPTKEEKTLLPEATRPLRRGLRRGLIVALTVVALTGAMLPQAAQAHHRTDIEPIG